MREDVHRVSGLYVLATKKDVYFFADTTVNIEPTAEELAEIALLSAEVARDFNVEPRIAMLSFSNFGSTKHPLAEKVQKATELLKEKAPGLMVDGEMQADTAVVPEIIEQDYPFSTLKGSANVLDLPEPGGWQRRLQTDGPHRRGGGTRAHSDGHVQTGPRAATGRHRRRDHQHGRHCGGGRAEERVVTACRWKRSRERGVPDRQITPEDW